MAVRHRPGRRSLAAIGAVGALLAVPILGMVTFRLSPMRAYQTDVNGVVTMDPPVWPGGGTLSLGVLALVGLVSLVVGTVALLTGRRSAARVALTVATIATFGSMYVFGLVVGVFATVAYRKVFQGAGTSTVERAAPEG